MQKKTIKPKKKPTKKLKLDSFERKIEFSAPTYRPVSPAKLQKIQTIIRKARKSRNVNIRIAEHVLDELKRRSQREGLPYQTLISSILHKYVTNRLVDEEVVRASFQLVSTNRAGAR